MQKTALYQKAALFCIISGMITAASACSKGAPPIVTETMGNGQSTEESAADSRQNLSQMLDYPEQYTVSKKGTLIELTSNAPVTVPGANEIPVKQVTRQKYSGKDYQQWKNILSNEAGILWSADQTNLNPDGSAVLQNTASDRNYYISLTQNPDEDTPDLLSFTNMAFLKGERTDSEEGINSEAEAEIRKKAEALARSLSSEPMIFQNMERQAFDAYEYEDGRWSLKESGKNGLCLTYVQSSGTIPIMADLPVMAYESNLQKSGMELVYTDDGTLVSIRASLWNYQESASDDPGFLLPFAVIAEVFEQYYLNFYETPGSFAPKLPSVGELTTMITVRNVQLEYGVSEDEKTGEYRLIPVWNFYGTTRLDSADLPSTESPLGESRPFLLITIDARDGSLPFEMEHAW